MTRDVNGTGNEIPASAGTTGDAELDRLMGQLSPPAPSDMLSARLKRNFPGPGLTAAAGEPVTRPCGGLFFMRQTGAFAAAAALVLAVALGVVAPPEQGGLEYDYAPVALYQETGDQAAPDETTDGSAAVSEGTLALPLVDGGAFGDGIVFAAYDMEDGTSAPDTSDGGDGVADAYDSDPASWDTGPLESIPLY